MGDVVYLSEQESVRMAENLNRWECEHPEGAVLALVAEQSKHLVGELQAVADELSYPIWGAIFPELVVNAEFRREGVVLLTFDKAPQVFPVKHAELGKLGISWADWMEHRLAKPKERGTLFFIFDSMIPNVGTILDGIYEQYGDSLAYVGVNAGSETFEPMPCLFDHQQQFGDGALVLYFPGDVAAHVAHGYTRPEVTKICSSSIGNRVRKIDGIPAFEMYKTLASETYGIEVEGDNFYEIATHFPLGWQHDSGELLVRIPVAKGDDGSIYCIGEVPEFALLTLLRSVEMQVGTRPDSGELIQAAVRKLKAQPAEAVLSFYCAGRRLHLGAAAISELEAMSQAMNDRTVIGALSLGEIGTGDNGKPYFHNAALVNINWPG